MTDEINGLKIALFAIFGLFGVLMTALGLASASDEVADRRREHNLDKLPPAEYAMHVQRRTK